MLYITPNQYTTKADDTKKLCSTIWDLRDDNGNIDDNMSLVCDRSDTPTEMQLFRNTLNTKCSVSYAQFVDYFDETTGVYSTSIDCSYHQLTDTDLLTFKLMKEIKGSLSLNDNNLTNLEGLNNLQSIGGYFYLYNNKIADVGGLVNLTTINGRFDISNNAVTNLDTLIGLHKVQGTVHIDNNNNLQDISGLSNIIGSNGKKIYIDTREYVVKADSTLDFCAVRWDIYDKTGNVIDDMSRLCEGYMYVPSDADKLRDILGKRCQVDSQTFYNSFAEDTGIYVGDISCHGVTDSELVGFKALLEVIGNFEIKKSSITTLDELIRLRKVTGTLSIEDNPILIDINGLSNILGVDGHKLIIDTNQYNSKADTTKDFCLTKWDLYDGTTNIENDMSKVCNQ